MEQQEKKLIENLFNKLSISEKNSLDRDILADNLIKSLLNKQPNAPYYMAQIILVQETAINKLSEKINSLEQQLSLMQKSEKKNSSSSFLSGFFRSNTPEHLSKNIDNNVSVSPDLQNFNNQLNSNNVMRGTPHAGGGAINTGGNLSSPVSSSNSGSSFLSSALQTATGVAGGMVMANMLTNLFEHKNSGQEIFNHLNSTADTHLEPEIVVEREIHDHYIHDEDNVSNDSYHNHDHYHDDQQDNDSIDVSDDDNFI